MINALSHRAGYCIALAALLAAAAVKPATAAEVTLTALFEPNALNPGHAAFENTTPNTGICATDSSICQYGNKSFKINANITYGEFVVGSAPENHATFKFPSAWRDVPVTNVATGAQSVVRWRATLFGGRYVLPRSVDSITGSGGQGGHKALWGSTWVNAPSPCSYSGLGWLGSTYYRFAWRLPAQEGRCTKVARFGLESMRLDEFSLAYEMISPSPLAMQSGTYLGALRLSVGPGKDIDLGLNATTDEEIVINLELTVRHEFQVVFPSVSPTVHLSPVGGWHQWIDYGRAPARLQQELPFTLTSSSDFSVKMRCEHEVSGRCGIEDLAAGTVVPVDVDVTMPGMTILGTGAPAINTGLISDASGTAAPRFTPDGYLVSRPSKLTFSANGASVTEMLKSPGSRWQGDVTVVFDSDP